MGATLTQSGYFGKGTPRPIPRMVKGLFRRIDPDVREMGILMGLFGKIHRALAGRIPIQPVDLGDLPVDMRWKIIIRRGYDPGDEDLWASKSECMFAVTCVLVRAGVEDGLIAAVLLDDDLGISAHCLAQPPHKHRDYVARQIGRAKEICNG